MLVSDSRGSRIQSFWDSSSDQAKQPICKLKDVVLLQFSWRRGAKGSRSQGVKWLLSKPLIAILSHPLVFTASVRVSVGL